MEALSVGVVALMCGIAAFFIVIAVAVILHANDPKNRSSGNTWLFDQWQPVVYDLIFRDKPTPSIGNLIGMDVDKYLSNCTLVRKEEQTKVVIIDKFVGYLIIALGCTVGIVVKNPYIMFASLLVAFPFVTLPIHFVESAADKRRFIIADELPRFLDMLHTALIIGVPVDNAIEITAKNLKGTILAEELLETLADTKVGACSWQEALEKLAERYEVDSFSDFVLDINNAYNLGASIQDSVARKSKEIKQTNLVAMKERASKLTNTILLPVFLFKIVPILAIMLIPIFMELKKSGF